jgi:hypothetical protein
MFRSYGIIYRRTRGPIINVLMFRPFCDVRPIEAANLTKRRMIGDPPSARLSDIFFWTIS